MLNNKNTFFAQSNLMSDHPHLQFDVLVHMAATELGNLSNNTSALSRGIESVAVAGAENERTQYLRDVTIMLEKYKKYAQNLLENPPVDSQLYRPS